MQNELMVLIKQVEKHDVIEAFRLLEVAMQQSATDHSTGNCLKDLPSSIIPVLIFYPGLTGIDYVFYLSLKEQLTWI